MRFSVRFEVFHHKENRSGTARKPSPMERRKNIAGATGEREMKVRWADPAISTKLNGS